MPQTDFDTKEGQVLAAGASLMQARKLPEAIASFDKIAADYERTYSDRAVKYNSARTMPEMLLYSLGVASAGKGKGVVVSANWGYAYYLKGYSLMELKRTAEAKAALLRAVDLSPQNSQFLSELGNVYEVEKNWPLGLQTFQRAESATEVSPPTAKTTELGRALRGQGYVYVELQQFDDAERVYRRCLELNKGDTAAMNELRYVQTQKAAKKR